jgi:selenocysteine lyase/cysteine desulfurase
MIWRHVGDRGGDSMDGIPATRRGLLQSIAGLSAVAAASPAKADLAGAIPPDWDFGLPPGVIHLNTASAGPTPDRVLQRAVAAWHKIESDPVKMSYGAEPDSVVGAADAVRGKVAMLVGCLPDEILLTSGTTAGITTIAHSMRLTEGDHVLLTDQEHEGGETGWLHRQRLDGIVVDRVSIPIGDHDTAAILRRFAAGIGPRTRAISVSHVLSSTGLRMPIAEIASIARKRGVLCVVDGAQAVGEIAVDVKTLGCDAYAASGHKWLMGPKGTGFVYIGKDAGQAIAPPEWLMERRYGSNSQGLGPMTLAIGLGEAIDRITEIGMSHVEQHNLALARRIHAALAGMPELEVVSPPPGPLATALVAARIPDAIDSRILRRRMQDRHGVVVKMAEKRWLNGIRFSPHIFNDEAQVERALAALRTELAGLQT